jgi:hypothetical protein
MAVAVFGTFLTSMSILGAFAIERGARWPTPWEILRRAGVFAWFALALASVVAALFGGIFESETLRVVSLAVALLGLLLGARALWRLFSLSPERGRSRLVVELLAASIRACRGSADRGEADVGEIDTEDHVPAWFVAPASLAPKRGVGVSIERVPAVMRAYADRGDAEAMSRLVDEVDAAAAAGLGPDGWPDTDSYLAAVDTVLGVQRRVFEELALRVLSRRLGDAVAGGALARAAETAIEVAGRARLFGVPLRNADLLRRAEPLAARHLAALCRFAGAVATEADEAGMTSLALTCEHAQQAGRWAIDPDPPGMTLPEGHPWQAGLYDPQSALVWLWSAAESPSGPFGVGLYALCQIATDGKFFGSYWDGFDVYTEIERRLRDKAAEMGREHRRRAREVLEGAGGLASVSLELGVARLSALPPRDEGPSQDDRHVACQLFLAGGGYKPTGRDPVADLARLLTDRRRGSLWTLVHDELGRLPEPAISPPLQPLHRRRDACALAVCLRLAPLADDESSKRRLRQLESFLAVLPDRLLEETASLAQRLVSGGEPRRLRSRKEWERELVAAVHFVRNIVPGSLPSPVAPAPRRAATPGPDPAIDGVARGASEGLPEGVPPAFAEALRRLGEGEAVEVDLIQCDRSWLDEWAELRSELDAELLAAVLRGQARVRRIVPYNVVGGNAERKMTRLHYRWTEALSSAVACFEPGPGAARRGSSPYEVRLTVLAPGLFGYITRLEDCVSIRPLGSKAAIDPEAEHFASIWGGSNPKGYFSEGSSGLIELGGRGVSHRRPQLEPAGDGGEKVCSRSGALFGGEL